MIILSKSFLIHVYLVHVYQLVQVISLYCSLVTHNLLCLLHHSMKE